jgi:ATP-GRASP peptide maturase of grasp-with-spasm system
MDTTTQKVEKWLTFFKKPYIIINEENRIECFKIEISDELKSKSWILINGKKIDLDSIRSSWLRKRIEPLAEPDGILKSKFGLQLRDEVVKINDYLFSFFSLRGGIGFKQPNDVNKLIVLEQAQKLGFIIPKTYLIKSDRQSEIDLDFRQSLISKPIGMGILSVDKNEMVCSRTFRVNEEDYINSEIMFGHLIQLEIEKFIELRVFFFKDRFWAMAIFSQNDEQTKLDFRNYNLKKPNRMVPFLLPSSLLKKLKHLSFSLGLQTGSYDLIIDKTFNYYFLEVNPFGQFGFLSQLCNYQIEREIAKIL